MASMGKNADQLLERAEQSRLVRYGLNLIPGGQVLESELFLRIRAEREARLQKFRSEVIERLENLELSKLSEEYLQSEEFLLFFEQLVVRVMEARRQEKILRFSDIFISNIRERQGAGYKLVYFLDCVANLEEDHIFALRALRESSATTTSVSLDELIDQDPDTIAIIQGDLLRLRLVVEVRNRSPVDHLLPVSMTKLGHSFILFLLQESQA